jgi:RNA polymerase sigma-70 factor (ECF subfamily)
LNNHLDHTLTDKQLVDRVLHDDTRSFALIVRKTEGLVAQIVFKMIDHPEDRKDLAQDIYLKAFRNLGGFRFEAKLSTWIAQIAYNTCLNYLEKKKLVFIPHIQDSEDAEWPVDIAGDHDPELRLNKKELSQILLSEMQTLQPIYRTLISLYHQEEMSYEEIGQITRLPSGTVKNYLFRARRALRNSILQKFKKEEL